MAPSIWDDCTAFSVTDTRWISTTSSTCVDTTVNYKYRVDHYVDVRNTDEYQKKIKELIRKAVIQKMKGSWHELKKEFKPIPIVRPSAQLRGVCFSGRGWA